MPPGAVELRVGDLGAIDSSLVKDASVILLNLLAYSDTRATLTAIGTTIPRTSAPGTMLLTLTAVPGCHRGLRLIDSFQVRVDWSPLTVAAYLYLVALPPPPGILAGELPAPAPLIGSGAAPPRGLRCPDRSALAADVDGQVEELLSSVDLQASQLPSRLQSMLAARNHDAAWLRMGWVRGDELSSWDCLFKDVEQLLALGSNLTVAGQERLANFWSDSTSVNSHKNLSNLDWTALGGPRTYGEARPSSIATLLHTLNLGPSDVFYDLGSGAGKVTLQAHLQTGAKRSVGIELEESRHLMAERTLAQLHGLGAIDESREVRFVLGDITDESLWADATVIFMLCTCFPEEVIRTVAGHVTKRPVGTRIVVGSFPLAAVAVSSDKSRELRLRWHVVLPTTFSAGEPFFVYEVANAGDDGHVEGVEEVQAAKSAAAVLAQMALS
eukprot:gnl/TRDRNA2_/TRDRNA2_102251_c0_seq1.p1 gnl/TRDRNA2_/TRDRNA2_102251_c0~~gnl/TRDRNA2_/TRDRNA2_102251_c0_seq1.p1  ORF type:complete len:502 (-),score=71.83 gnl/TRDRNA2_/TRDRNA2_102251_c0_seq1:20-1342(-)